MKGNLPVQPHINAGILQGSIIFSALFKHCCLSMLSGYSTASRFSLWTLNSPGVILKWRRLETTLNDIP